MTKKKEIEPKYIDVELLGGMGLYGTTDNEEIADYKRSSDIGSAGQHDKGIYKEDGSDGATASLEDNSQRD